MNKKSINERTQMYTIFVKITTLEWFELCVQSSFVKSEKNTSCNIELLTSVTGKISKCMKKSRSTIQKQKKWHVFVLNNGDNYCNVNMAIRDCENCSII